MRTDFQQEDKQQPSNLELHFLLEAYSRGEIDFAEWRKRAVAWAKAILEKQGDKHNGREAA